MVMAVTVPLPPSALECSRATVVVVVVAVRSTCLFAVGRFGTRHTTHYEKSVRRPPRWGTAIGCVQREVFVG